jgi:hypothetical protein
MNHLKYFLTRYLVKFGSLAIALFLFAMAILSMDGTSGIAPFFGSVWSVPLMLLMFVLFVVSIYRYPFRAKNDVCQTKGHSISGCKCARCGMVIDSSRHVWDGCKCSHCGERKDADDPLHKWNDCVCTHCGAARDGEHDWAEIQSNYYGGNDVNGWGPGGETNTEYECRRCGIRMERSIKDDD